MSSFIKENKIISMALSLLGGVADKAGYGKRKKKAKRVVKRRGTGLRILPPMRVVV